MDIHERIERARETAGINRKAFSRMFKPPVSFETVRGWEEGLHTPRPPKLRAIATLTGVRYEWLVAEAGPMRTGEADLKLVTINDVAAQVRRMSREERLLYLRAIADVESEGK